MTEPFTLSCIIPAYNEAPRIANIVKLALSAPSITEVCVIDDGSNDGTLDQVRRFPQIHLIAKTKNQGKTKAVIDGIEATKSSHLIFLDADLQNLTIEAIEALIAPVKSGEYDVSFSLRKNAPALWHLLGIDYISGERVIPRTLLVNKVDAMHNLPRFGLEVFMNEQIISNNLRLKIVPWTQVESPLKAQKQGILRGIWADVLMIMDIVRTIGFLKIIKQIKSLKQISK